MPQTDTSTATTGGDPALAAALGRIPSGLFVVGWSDAGTDRSMLASWVMQAGFEPPLVSVAVGRSRDLLDAIERGASFGISVLGDSQRSLLARFGKPAADAFEGLAVRRTPGGSPVLAEASAWLDCRPVAQMAQGDHVVVLAAVVSAAAGENPQPLVHVRKNGLRY